MQQKKVLVIIPTFNEGLAIDYIISKIKNLGGLDVLVIDDGSTDDTITKSKKAGAEVISHPFNMGYGIALQTGYKYAVLNNYDFLIQLDGDGQHDPEYIPDFIRELESKDTDLVLGSRFLAKSRYRIPFIRKIGMLFFREILSLLMNKRLTDPTSGYQAMNKKVLRLYAKDIFPHDYPDADIILSMHLAGIKIKEISTVMYKGAQNKSMHAGIRPVYYVFKMIISLFITLIRPRGE